jgi:ubiquinone/menaquinone biosynthesis C-methylase UbiE
MLTLARANADRTRITNARFLHGRIENIQLPHNHGDVVISNCVINLSRRQAPRPGRGVSRPQARRTTRHQ